MDQVCETFMVLFLVKMELNILDLHSFLLYETSSKCFLQHFSFCVSLKKVSNMSLERHEGE